MSNIFSFIDLMPGYVSVVDLKGNYLAFNNNLKELMSINCPEGIKAGSHCQSQINRINELIDSPIGTIINWEFKSQGICLAVSSVRDESYIISQAVNITHHKKLEEELRMSERRNQILLEQIPKTLQNSAGRRQPEVENLISILTQNPIVSQSDNDDSLVRIEVELRHNSERLNNLEKLIYLEENCVRNKINQLELKQSSDEDYKQEFEQVIQLTSVFRSIPGGFKAFIIAVILFQVCLTFVVENLEVLNLTNLIELIGE